MDKAVWSAADAAKATGGKISGAWEARGVVIDSRAASGAELFVALPGERADGHDFVAGALAKGAAAALVSRPVPGVDAARLLIVPDVQAALEALGRMGRARSAAKIIAVTGSVGKTSAKEMLRLALAAHGPTFAGHGNFNNHIGTPLNLANLPESAEFGVFELGMNHAGELSALTRQVRPQVALITAVEAVHLEFFASVDAIADAKAEIFAGLEAGGVAILNRDNAQFNRLAQKVGGAKILSFGAHEQSDIRLLAYHATHDGSRITARVSGQEISYRLGALGRHWALASLMALAVSEALGLDVKKTAGALAEFHELPGRGSLHTINVPGGAALLVDDSYNASPAAMRVAFARMKELRDSGIASGRLIAALGEMRELGEGAPELHAALAQDIQAAGIDVVFTAWPLMRHLYDALPASLRAAHAPDAAALLPMLRAALKPGDALLVKGSHGSKMYTIAEALIKGEQKRHAV